MHNEIMLFFYHLTTLTDCISLSSAVATNLQKKPWDLWGFVPSCCLCLPKQGKGSALWSFHLQKVLVLAHFYRLKLLSSLDMYCTILCKCETHLTWGSQSEFRVLVLWLPGQLGLGRYLIEKEESQPYTPARIQNTCQVLAPHPEWISTKWHVSHSQPGKQNPCPKCNPKGQSIHSLSCWLLWLCSQRGSGEE